MSNNRYQDSALLSKAQDKRSKNSPDYYGRVEFSEDTIRYLAEQLRDGGEPTLRIAVWRKENDRGIYLSAQLSIPQQQGEGRAAQRGGGGERRVRQQAERTQRSQQNRRMEPREVIDDNFDDEIPF